MVRELPYETQTELIHSAPHHRERHNSNPSEEPDVDSGAEAPSGSSSVKDGYEKTTSRHPSAPSLTPPAPPLAAHPRPPSQLKDFFLLRRRKGSDLDLDSVATQPSVFDDPDFAKFHAPHDKWENKHRFSPQCRWTWREEKALVRKLDKRIALAAFIFFFCLDLDRENIAQANSDGMLEDLGLTTNDYNLGNTLFKVAFLCAELPSQMVSKKLGADRWIPIQLVLWSIASGAQFWMKGRASFLALRWLIGMLQGGFIPDVVLWLSYFYPKAELPLRLAFFWTSNYLVKIVSPFLAIGLLKLRGHNGHAGWQYLFLIEALLTLVVGVAAFFHMPASPTESKNALYRKGWFTEREEFIMVNRVIRDDPSKGSMHNRQGINFDGFKKSLLDFDLWPMYFLGLIFMLPSYPLSNYLTLQLKNLGFSTEETNALSIPAPAIGLVLLLVVTVISESVDNRSFVAMSYSVWNFASYLALYKLPANGSPWIYWTVATIQQAAPYVHALQVAWISRQSGSVRTRTISAAVYNMMVQVSAILGANVYQKDDAPVYRKGNLAMVILSAFNCVMYGESKGQERERGLGQQERARTANTSIFWPVLLFAYYSWRNRSRERKWDAMTKVSGCDVTNDSLESLLRAPSSSCAIVYRRSNCSTCPAPKTKAIADWTGVLLHKHNMPMTLALGHARFTVGNGRER